VAQALQTTAGELQPWHHAICATPFGTVGVRFHRALAVLAFDCICKPDVAAVLWSRLLTAGVTPAGTQAHEILRVEAGFPAYGIDMDENRFVVEVGRSDSISYTKGCYLGQEPIVMARDRGQVNRLLTGIVAGPGDVLPPGTALFRDGVEVGTTTSSVWSPRAKHVVGLAYLRRGHQEPGTELAVAPPEAGRKAVAASLPLAPVDTL
jgi:tRNA-modifying protein YgfZ